MSHVATLMASQKCAQVRMELTKSSSPFCRWLIEESTRLQNIAEEGIDAIVTNPQRLNDFQNFYNLFLTVEQKGNQLGVSGNFGETLSKKMLEILPVAKPFIQDFVEVLSLEKRQRFEGLLCSEIPKQLGLNNDSAGLTAFMAGLSMSDLSPSTQKNITSVLASALSEVETSTRFEILARVDAYIRSGHARADFEGTTPDAQHLRDAFEQLNTTQAGSKSAKILVRQATDTLFRVLDHRMHKVKVVADKIIDYGSYVHQPGYKFNSKLPVCAQRAESGTLDVAILEYDKANRWIIGMATSVKTSEWLGREGEQYNRQTNENLQWHFIDLTRGKKEEPRPMRVPQTTSPSIVYNALINVNSTKNKLASQLGAQLNSDVVQSVNALVLLKILANRKDSDQSRAAHIGCIGAPVNQKIVQSLGTDQFSKIAADQLMLAIEGLTNCAIENQKMAASSDLVSAMNLSASLLDAYTDNKYLLEKAPWAEWHTKLMNLKDSVEAGDFEAIRRLANVVELYHYKNAATMSMAP